MEYVIITLLVILIILVTISLFHKEDKAEKEMIERLGKFEVNINKYMYESSNNLEKSLKEDFNSLSNIIEQRLILMDDKVNNKLNENFKRTSETFTNIVSRLAIIDKAQKNIEELSTDIVSLQNILTDKKSRGTFGEVNLYNILNNIFGPENKTMYEVQYTLPNATVADAILHAPKPLGEVVIDSKFPLENYQKMMNKDLPPSERKKYETLFKDNLKKHIDDISSKYIIPGTTSDQAILFLPAEAIFAEINAYHPEIIEYSYKKRVWITSPTTLMSSLTMIQMIVKNMERDKYASIIHDELKRLALEFDRYKDRWQKLKDSANTLTKRIDEVSITTGKISKRFDDISNVKIEKIEEDNEKEI